MTSEQHFCFVSGLYWNDVMATICVILHQLTWLIFTVHLLTAVLDVTPNACGLRNLLEIQPDLFYLLLIPVRPVLYLLFNAVIFWLRYYSISLFNLKKQKLCLLLIVCWTMELFDMSLWWYSYASKLSGSSMCALILPSWVLKKVNTAYWSFEKVLSGSI